MRLLRFLACASSAVAMMGACASSPDHLAVDRETETGSDSAAIINGTLDTTHQAVVTLYGQQGNEAGVCSGTIVKIDPQSKIGWVLTAGHCVIVPPIIVLQGDDYAAPSALRYEVLDYVSHPNYDKTQTTSPYDLAMVRIVGVDSTTPVIPIATAPDGCTSGASVVSVGYGRTTTSDTAPPNTVRKRITRTLNSVTTTKVEYSLATGGICQGDSGGPVLTTVAGREAVAAVHSYVSGECNGQGTSGRVSAAAAWLTSVLGQAAPPATCDLCEKATFSGKQKCATLERECLADTACKAYYDCATKCSSKSCRDACSAKTPLGTGPFLAVTQCGCNVGCTSECSAKCVSVPKCGYDFPKDDCRTCTESSCCAQASACAADGLCYTCLKDPTAEGCDTSALHKALTQCVGTSCSETCGVPKVEEGTDPASGEPGSGGTTTTTTSNGCSASPTTPVPWRSAWLLAALIPIARRVRRRRAP